MISLYPVVWFCCGDRTYFTYSIIGLAVASSGTVLKVEDIPRTKFVTLALKRSGLGLEVHCLRTLSIIAIIVTSITANATSRGARK